MTGWRLLLLVGAFSLFACEAKRHEPVNLEVLEIRSPANDLICHVRRLSEAQNLSFHYGTSEQSFGTMTTFRLIGDNFEIVLLNPEKAFSYYLSAYADPPEPEARTRAAAAYAAFKTALLKETKAPCRT